MTDIPVAAEQAALPGGDALWRNREFLLYAVGRFASGIGSLMVTVAIGWQIYDRTGSATALGLVGLVQFVPALVLALPGGQVADVVDRRLVLTACSLADARPGAVGGDHGRPIGDAAVPPRCRHRRDTRLRDAGPAGDPAQPGAAPPVRSGGGRRLLACSGRDDPRPGDRGAVYALGPAAVYAGAALLSLASALACAALRPRFGRPADAAARGSRGLSGFLDGVAFVRGRPALLGAISLDLVAVLLGGATALLPIYARDILMTGPIGLGLLRSAPAVGAAAMAIALARWPLRRQAGRTMFADVALFGSATIAFGLAHHIALSLVALVVLGAADMIACSCVKCWCSSRPPTRCAAG